jgi:hypothetical protein
VKFGFWLELKPFLFIIHFSSSFTKSVQFYTVKYVIGVRGRSHALFYLTIVTTLEKNEFIAA